MDEEDIKALNRARVTAGWSYLGAIIPLIGLILGAISFSNLSSIDIPDSEKAKRRIKSVKRLAIGGILLSIIFALVYGALTYANINKNKADQQMSAKTSAENKRASCKKQVDEYNDKVKAINNEYSDMGNYSATGSDSFTTSPQYCDTNTSEAVSTAKKNYNEAVIAAKKRCLYLADQDYNSDLKANAVTTSTDSEGQTIYRTSQANMQRIESSYQESKDSCSN